MLRDLISAVLASEPELCVVGELTDDEGSLQAVIRANADVVIVGLRDTEFPDFCTRLLKTSPATKVFGLSPEGRHGFQFRAELEPVALGEVSPSMLLDVIRRLGRERV